MDTAMILEQACVVVIYQLQYLPCGWQQSLEVVPLDTARAYIHRFPLRITPGIGIANIWVHRCQDTV
jgi:hypothetical protein